MSETPSLDLQQDPPKRKLSKLGLAIGVLVGAILGFAMIEVTDPAIVPPRDGVVDSRLLSDRDS
jgi:hypothetical protein